LSFRCKKRDKETKNETQLQLATRTQKETKMGCASSQEHGSRRWQNSDSGMIDVHQLPNTSNRSDQNQTHLPNQTQSFKQDKNGKPVTNDVHSHNAANTKGKSKSDSLPSSKQKNEKADAALYKNPFARKTVEDIVNEATDHLLRHRMGNAASRRGPAMGRHQGSGDGAATNNTLTVANLDAHTREERQNASTEPPKGRETVEVAAAGTCTMLQRQHVVNTTKPGDAVTPGATLAMLNSSQEMRAAKAARCEPVLPREELTAHLPVGDEPDRGWEGHDLVASPSSDRHALAPTPAEGVLVITDEPVSPLEFNNDGDDHNCDAAVQKGDARQTTGLVDLVDASFAASHDPALRQPQGRRQRAADQQDRAYEQLMTRRSERITGWIDGAPAPAWPHGESVRQDDIRDASAFSVTFNSAVA
jgi:hypothetical protein